MPALASWSGREWATNNLPTSFGGRIGLPLILASILFAAQATAQQVDCGFVVETYAALPDLDPASLSFDPATGDLYVGRDIQPGPLTDHAPIWRINAVGGSVTAYGCAIDDPDGVLFDASGLLSGTPGAVLVASSTYGTYTGVILGTTNPCSGTPGTIYPDSSSYYNPYDMIVDGMGRFLMTNIPDLPSSGEVWVDAAPPSGMLTRLISGAARVCGIAVDQQDRIFLAGTDPAGAYYGTIAIYSAAGTFDHFLATGLVSSNGIGNHAIAIGPGSAPWGTDVFTVNAGTGELLRIDPTTGAFSTVGTGFSGYYPDAAFGPDGALYLADFWQDRILRVRSAPSAPTVCAVVPDHGPNTGILGVVISGTGLFDASAVYFGSTPASFTVDSDTQITADISSTGTVGFVDVSVTTPRGTGTLRNGFDYFLPPEPIGTPCGAPYLTWSGSPTLGETFTLATENLGSHDQFLLIDRSNIPNPKFAPYLFNCRVLVRPDWIVPLGNNPSHSIAIPEDVALLGVHLRIQSLVRASPSVMTQALDALIGE